jgi:hypothetical protein
MVIDPYYQTLKIQDERDTINSYARSIGIWKQMIEREKDETQKQYFQYFMDVDAIYLEKANEKLTRFRAELDAHEHR